MTTTPDHNAAGQRPTEADKEEVEPQASDGNRQRARTLQAEDRGSGRPGRTCPLRARQEGSPRYMGDSRGQREMAVDLQSNGQQELTSQFPS
jgi:hypothetical protein